jgi:hypothetical protein
MQFIQVRRWAWGVSDIAYFANQAFFKMNKIPLHKKIAKGWRLAGRALKLVNGAAYPAAGGLSDTIFPYIQSNSAFWLTNCRSMPAACSVSPWLVSYSRFT